MNCSQLAHVAAIHPPATDDAIQRIQAAIGVPLPPNYLALLRCSDGLEPYNSHYSICLFATSELGEMNTAYEVRDYLPAFVCIGFDGGGRGIFLRCGDSPSEVYLCEMGALAPDQLRSIAPDLETWISQGFDLNDPPPHTHPPAIDIYLIRAPSGGLKELYRLTQALNLTIPVNELRHILDHLPCCLLKAAPYLPYAWKCAELNAGEPCIAAYEVDQLDRPIPLQRLK